MKALSTFVIAVALIAGMVSCGPAPTPTQYNLTISSTEGGSVTTPGEGTPSYDEGEVVNLVAVAEEGYHFVNWTGDVGTVDNVSSAVTTITMSDDYEITANFARGPAIPLENPGTFVQMSPEHGGWLVPVDSLDPAWGYDVVSGEQVQYIYETLLFYDGEKVDRFVPVLATEWELLDDNVTYRFKVRDGVKFHEGGDLTPSDVEYSFERAMAQDRGGGPIWMLYRPLLGLWESRDGNGNIVVAFDQIDDAVEVDGDWVVFHLSDPAWHLAFLQILCGPWASIVDKEWCVAQGDWDGSAATWEAYNNPDRSVSYLYDHTNGTGPWQLDEWDPGVEIKLVRNDNYWREPAAFQMVITKFVEEWDTRKAALLAGYADLIYVPRDHVGELDGIQDLNVYKDLPALESDAFFFNMKVARNSSYIGSGALDGNGIPTDFFTDIDVRKGFCYAFDYETYIKDAWLGAVQRLGSPVCEGLPCFNPDASMYSLDMTKAEEHLRLAWDGEVWEKGFKFTLLYVSGSLPGETACKILAENLYAINPEFQVSIQPIARENYGQKTRRTRDMPMFLASWMADYPHPDNFVWGFMASDGVFAEWQDYGYPELDGLIEDAFKELDPVVQKDMYYELQQLYYEEAPSIMLGQPLGRRYFTKYIHGFYFNPMICSWYLPGPLYYMSKSSP